jgi:hypothetical protein
MQGIRRYLMLIGVHLMGAYLMGVYLTGMYLTGVYLTDVHLMGVYLTGMHLMGVYLTGVYLMGVQRLMDVYLIRHLIGVYLMGVHLIDVYFMDVFMLGKCHSPPAVKIHAGCPTPQPSLCLRPISPQFVPPDTSRTRPQGHFGRGGGFCPEVRRARG